MRKVNGRKMRWVLFVVSAATAVAASAQTFNSLASFDYSDGADASSGLVQGVDGNFYGETAYGPAASEGTVYKITPEGVVTSLGSFDYADGFDPFGTLVLGTDGDFYGVTTNGGSNYCETGCGTVFKITPEGSLTTLHVFCLETPTCNDGAIPWAALIQGPDGNFYGTTSGGTYSLGTVFRITPGGGFTQG